MDLATLNAVNPLFWLTLVVLVVMVAAITGLQPKGGRPAARTRLMTVGRVILILLAVAIAYAAFRAR